MTNENDIQFMERAVELSRKCTSESNKNSPSVGAVVVKDGQILAETYRGQFGSGDHAEYEALEIALKDHPVSGCTVYTALEPCTARNAPKIPCARRIIERKVERVVIGIVDPNPIIRGNGILSLRSANIDVALFPKELASRLEELNRNFIREQESKYQQIAGNAESPHERLDSMLARKALNTFPEATLGRLVHGVQVQSIHIDDIEAFDESVVVFWSPLMKFSGDEIRNVFDNFMDRATILSVQAPDFFSSSSNPDKYTSRGPHEIHGDWIERYEAFKTNAVQMHTYWSKFVEIVRKKWPELIIEIIGPMV